MKIERALIVREPYITEILEGRKTWEMRSKATQVRGPIGLIRKGSGLVVGVAKLAGVLPTLTQEDMLKALNRHRIARQQILSGAIGNWLTPRVLETACRLPAPVPYEHRSGAVVWVILGESVRAGLRAQFPAGWAAEDGRSTGDQADCACQQSARLATNTPTAVASETVSVPDSGGVVKDLSATVETETSFEEPVKGVSSRHKEDRNLGTASQHERVPFARDGSWFGPHVRSRSGVFTVGEKDSPRKFDNYSEALSYLRQMPVAKWRRPNSVGNWGLVSAVRWDKPRSR